MAGESDGQRKCGGRKRGRQGWGHESLNLVFKELTVKNSLFSKSFSCCMPQEKEENREKIGGEE